MAIKDWGKFIALGLIWGSSFFWIKIAVQEIGPFTLVSFRVLFALLGILAVIAYRRTALPGRRRWWAFGVLGLFNVALPFVLISWAEQNISSGIAAILNSTMPLFTILIAPLFLADERITRARMVGLVLGFLGVVVLVSGKIEFGLGGYQLGVAAMLIASLCYAVSAIFARKQTQGMAVEAQSIGQMMAAWLFIIPATAMVEAPFTPPALPITWMAVAWLGLLGSCVATLLYYSLINSVGPTRTVLVSYIFPLVGVVLGIIFLNERPDWQLVVGGFLIIGGIGMVNRRQSNG